MERIRALHTDRKEPSDSMGNKQILVQLARALLELQNISIAQPIVNYLSKWNYGEKAWAASPWHMENNLSLL